MSGPAPIPPSMMAARVSKCSDDEICARGIRDVLHMLRQLEDDYKWLLCKHNNTFADPNNQQTLTKMSTDNNTLREANQKLNYDNQEMRDLCCFLDDDRQRSRKLAREWQKFGRYTATVMRREVTSYQVKLQDLDRQQEELIRENNELKQLCISLDQELSGVSFDRDDGDGSSNTTTASEHRLDDVTNVSSDATNHVYVPGVTEVPPVLRHSSDNLLHNGVDVPGRMEHLRIDRTQLISPPPPPPAYPIPPTAHAPIPRRHTPLHMYPNTPPDTTQYVHDNHSSASQPARLPGGQPPMAGAVGNVTRVQEVHNNFAPSDEDDNITRNEKAIVREMCNKMLAGGVAKVRGHEDESKAARCINQKLEM